MTVKHGFLSWKPMVTVATIDFPVIPVIVFVINQTRTINIHNKLIPAKNTIMVFVRKIYVRK